MRGLTRGRVECGCGPCRAAARIDTMQWRVPVGHEQNDAFAVPASAHHPRRVCQRHSAPAGKIDAPQFPLGSERDRLAVGRPERLERVFAVGKRTGVERVERTYPELPAPVSGAACESERSPVG